MAKKNDTYSIGQFGQLRKGHDVYVNSLRRHINRHAFIAHRHKHDFYLAVIFTRGTGTHEIDFTTYPVRPGSVFVLYPGQAHAWSLSPDADGYIFFHTQEFYEYGFVAEKIRGYPFFGPGGRPHIVLKPVAQKSVKLLLQQVLDEYGRDDVMGLQKLRLLVNLFYIELVRAYVPGKLVAVQNPAYRVKLQELQALVDKHFLTVKSPSAYAGMMSITEKHLNRICKECLNQTTSEIIVARILLEAKRLLAKPGIQVAQVSLQLGYIDHSYFARLFKKHSGITPTQFQQGLNR